MKKILFVRKYKKTSGGQIKVRDYFRHCLAHPELEPFVYFTPDSEPRQDATWAMIPAERIVSALALEEYDLLFLAGRDWDLLPQDLSGKKILNLIQHVKHGDPRDPRFAYLARPAYRLCVGREVSDAIASHANGSVTVIPNGVPLEIFSADEKKNAETVLIWARKNPKLGRSLSEALSASGVRVTLLCDYLPREDFAAALRATDIFVALPNPREGFYLPALEGMASGCAVVCADAEGNRAFSLHNETCLTPKLDDLTSHCEMVNELLRDAALKEKLQRNGTKLAQAYSLAQERESFFRLLAEHKLV